MQRMRADSEKRVRIEFEFRPSSFKVHRHDARQCDCIVCWHHDWPDVPDRIEVIELKRFFGVPFKVWIQIALKSQWHWLDDRDQLTWALSNRVTHGDLLLMYRGYPSCGITDVFRFSGYALRRGSASWRAGDCYYGRIERICKLDAPVFLDDLRTHKVLRTASFVRMNLQGRGHVVSEYWPYLYSILCDRNPKNRKRLGAFNPEKL